MSCHLSNLSKPVSLVYDHVGKVAILVTVLCFLTKLLGPINQSINPDFLNGLNGKDHC